MNFDSVLMVIGLVLVCGFSWLWVILFLAFKQAKQQWHKIAIVVIWLMLLPISILVALDTLSSTYRVLERGFFALAINFIQLCAGTIPTVF